MLFNIEINTDEKKYFESLYNTIITNDATEKSFIFQKYYQHFNEILKICGINTISALPKPKKNNELDTIAINDLYFEAIDLFVYKKKGHHYELLIYEFKINPGFAMNMLSQINLCYDFSENLDIIQDNEQARNADIVNGAMKAANRMIEDRKKMTERSIIDKTAAFFYSKKTIFTLPLAAAALVMLIFSTLRISNILKNQPVYTAFGDFTIIDTIGKLVEKISISTDNTNIEVYLVMFSISLIIVISLLILFIINTIKKSGLH